MEEVIPKPKVDYSYAGKESASQHFKDVIPKELIPTKRTGNYFGWIFLVVIVIAFFQFPIGSIMAGRTDIVVGIGYPWHFLEFDLQNAEKFPLRIAGLLFDLLLYALIAYSIEVASTLVMKNPMLKSKDEIKQRPKVFQDNRPKSIAEKVTQKIIEKNVTKNPTDLNNQKKSLML